MKKIMNQLMVTVVGLVAAMALGQPQAAWAGGTNSWQFPSSATNVNCIGSPGGATATIFYTPPMSTGWGAQKPPMSGNANGIWDLANNGFITLTNLSGVVGGPGQARTFTVSVVELFSGPYNALAPISIPGATCVSNTQSVAANPTGSSVGLTSEWVVNVTQWTVPSGTTVNSAVITAATNGTMVNLLAVYTSGNVVQQPPTPQLTIQSVGSQQVQISWSSSLTNVLQSTSDLSNPQWTAVNATVQVNGSVNSVTIGATGAVQFYRLKP